MTVDYNFRYFFIFNFDFMQLFRESKLIYHLNKEMYKFT